jgi:hypothetical protein
MHATRLVQHWSSSGVSKIAYETAVLPSVRAIVGICPRLCAHVGSLFYCVVCVAVMSVSVTNRML